MSQNFGSPAPAVSTQIANELGQSTEAAVSQKLLTDTVGDIEAALDAINGVTNDSE